MKQRLPRVLHGRSGFVLGLVLIVAALVAPDEGRADAASLIVKNVCQDPVVVFDHKWATLNFSASDLYFMKDNGSVEEVSEGGREFDKYEDLYVLAHGGNGEIDGMKFAKFVDWLKAAHDSNPKSVMFKVCSGVDLLKLTYDKYNKEVNKLTASVGRCALTGDGNYGLKNAKYRDQPNPKPGDDEKEWTRIVGEVLKKWNDGKYPGQLVSYAAYCKSIVDPLNAKKLREFMAQVVVDFSKTGTDVDYLKLVELMAGGNAPTVCGKDPVGDGKSVDCP